MLSDFISLEAPAKINLTLAVLGHRPDGFHEIESWIVKIAWHDKMTFEPSPKLEFKVIGDQKGLAADPSNLVIRAAEALAQDAGRSPAVSITLDKLIPIGAGLGGGSSDAAATLRGLNQLWELRRPVDRLHTISQQIGSDVPLFLDEATAVVARGRGEQIERLASSWQGWLAVIVPPYSLSTAAVYGAFSPNRPPSRPDGHPWILPNRPAMVLQDDIFNDLEPAAFSLEPRLAALHSVLDGLQGRRVRMTGSGSCLFTLFDDRKDAEEWRREAINRTPPPIRIEVVSTIGGSVI